MSQLFAVLDNCPFEPLQLKEAKAASGSRAKAGEKRCSKVMLPDHTVGEAQWAAPNAFAAA